MNIYECINFIFCLIDYYPEKRPSGKQIKRLYGSFGKVCYLLIVNGEDWNFNRIVFYIILRDSVIL